MWTEHYALQHDEKRGWVVVLPALEEVAGPFELANEAIEWAKENSVNHSYTVLLVERGKWEGSDTYETVCVSAISFAHAAQLAGNKDNVLAVWETSSGIAFK